MDYTSGFLIIVGIWTLLSAARYLVFASVAFGGKTSLLVRFWPKRQLTANKPSKDQIKREIISSAQTALVFGFVFAVINVLTKFGFNEVYSNISDHGWAYYLFTLGLVVLGHDTYFYWAHRLMHLPSLYKKTHAGHHKSTNPTPFSAWSFDWAEALVHVTYILILTLAMPMHSSVLLFLAFWSMTFNVLGHLGHEVFPRAWAKKPFSNTVTHHHMHHQTFNYNYGLYFPWWDRMMGTEHPQYVEVFEEIVDPDREEIRNIAVMARKPKRKKEDRSPELKAAREITA